MAASLRAARSAALRLGRSSRCASYSAYRPPLSDSGQQPHTGQVARMTPINRQPARPVEDIMKYGVMTTKEQRQELDQKRKARTFRELARL